MAKEDATKNESEADLMGEFDVEEEDFDESKYLEPIQEVDFEDDEEKYVEVDPDLYEDDYPDIDFKVIDKIRETDVSSEQVLAKILNSKTERNYTSVEKEALKIKLKDIVKSGKFFGVIRKGTKLIHLRSGKIFYNQKLLTVQAYRKNDYEGYKLLINKNGYSTYKVLAHQIENIKEITKLYEPPENFTETKVKKDYRLTDRDLKTEVQFNFHAGVTNSAFLKELSRSRSGIAQSVRYEGEYIGKFNFPFKIGLTANYENTFASFSNGGRYNLSALSLGPIFKSKKFKWGKSIYMTHLQVRHAVFSNLSVDSPAISGNYNLSQTSLAVGVEMIDKTFLGDLVYGLNYQRQWNKPSSNSEAADFSSQNTLNDSIMISVGYLKDILW